MLCDEPCFPWELRDVQLINWCLGKHECDMRILYCNRERIDDIVHRLSCRQSLTKELTNILNQELFHLTLLLFNCFGFLWFDVILFFKLTNEGGDVVIQLNRYDMSIFGRISYFCNNTTLFCDLVFNVLLFLLQMNSSNKGIPTNLGEIPKWILETLWIKVVKGCDTVLNGIIDELILPSVAREVWPVCQVLCYLENTLTNVVWDLWLGLVFLLCRISLLSVLNNCCVEILVIDVRNFLLWFCHNHFSN